jgi:hypothetical protein
MTKLRLLPLELWRLSNIDGWSQECVKHDHSPKITYTMSTLGQHQLIKKGRWDQVPWRSKHPLLTGQTNRVPLVEIRYTVNQRVWHKSFGKLIYYWFCIVDHDPFTTTFQLYWNVLIQRPFKYIETSRLYSYGFGAERELIMIQLLWHRSLDRKDRPVIRPLW